MSEMQRDDQTDHPETVDTEEKRQHQRKPVRLSVKLSCDRINGEKQARDISLSGIFVETTDAIALGQDIQLTIPFANQEHQIKIKGTVARVTNDGIGVQFDVYAIDIE